VRRAKPRFTAVLPRDRGGGFSFDSKLAPHRHPAMPPPKWHRLSVPPDLAKAREAARKIRHWLARRALDESTLFACELALVEACNNAAQHLSPNGQDHPIEIEAICTDTLVTLALRDRTAGFDLPTHAAQPAPDAAAGRDPFLIQSMMDEVRYEHGTDAKHAHDAKNFPVNSDTETHHATSSGRLPPMVFVNEFQPSSRFHRVAS